MTARGHAARFAQQHIVQQRIHAGRHVIGIDIPARIEIQIRPTPFPPADVAEMRHRIEARINNIGHREDKTAGVHKAKRPNEFDLVAGLRSFVRSVSMMQRDTDLR